MADLSVTNPQLAAQISNAVATFHEFSETQYGVMGTPPDGGPFGNGTVYVTDAPGGHRTLVTSYPTLAASFEGPVANAQAAYDLANSTLIQTEAFAANAAASAGEAADSLTAIGVAVDVAAGHAAQAGQHSSNAAGFAATAEDYRDELAAEIGVLHQGVADLANAVEDQSDLVAAVAVAQAVVLAANTNVNTANAVINTKAAVVAGQADAVALANAAVAENTAMTAGYAADAEAARDVTYVARDIAQDAANSATGSEQAAADSAATAIEKAAEAVVSATEAFDANASAWAAVANATAIVGGDFLPIGSKAGITDAEAGVNDSLYMTPAKTKAAILALAGDATEQFSITVTATGAVQTVDIGVELELSELLIYQNGVEQNGHDITLLGTALSFTRPAGDEIRIVLPGGYRGRSFEPHVYGNSVVERDLIDIANAGVGLTFLDMSTGTFYWSNTIGWSEGVTLTGPQGVQGIQGEPGLDGADGVDGANAYVVAITAGFVGSQSAWLASLKGETGDQGPQGVKGDTGDIATLNSGHVTTALGYTPANKAGDVFGGGIAVNGAAGSTREFAVRTGGSYRWTFGGTGDAESGSNAGTDFFIIRFSDAVSYIDTPLRISRSTGVVRFEKAPTIGGAAIGALTNSAPLVLGNTAAAGSASDAARSDHVHQFPLAAVGTTFTATGSLTAADHGKVVEWNAASAALTLPNDLPVGFNCVVRVIHATGVPTFTAASGATIRQSDGFTKARKQWSEVSVSVRANSTGSAAEYVLSGDLSA